MPNIQSQTFTYTTEFQLAFFGSATLKSSPVNEIISLWRPALLLYEMSVWENSFHLTAIKSVSWRTSNKWATCFKATIEHFWEKNHKKAVKLVLSPMQYCRQSTPISDWTHFFFYNVIFLSNPTLHLFNLWRLFRHIIQSREGCHFLYTNQQAGKAINFNMCLLH